MTLSSLTLIPWIGELHRYLGTYAMWRETAIGGAYVPTLMVLFVACTGLTWLIDTSIAHLGLYRWIWHPPLFRVSVFVCLLSITGLCLLG